MPHSIRIRSASNSENNYEVGVEGGIEPKSGIGGRDHIENDGRRAVGRVVGGTDEYSYWGAKTAIRADDPEDLEISINGGAFKPSTKYGAIPLDGDSDSSRKASTPEPQQPPSPRGSWTPITPVGARRWESERPTYGVVQRHPETICDRTVRITEEKSAFQGEYDRRNARYGSLQNAANYVENRINHDIELRLHTGTTRNEPGDAVSLGPIYEHPTKGAGLSIVGDKTARADYELDVRQFNVALRASVTVGGTGGFLEGFSLTGCVVGYGGAQFGFDDMVLRPSGRRGDGVPLAGYGGFYTFRNCKIRGKNLAKLRNGGTYALVGCDIKVDGALAETGIDGGTIVLSGGNSVSAGAGQLADSNDPVTVLDPNHQTEGLDAGSARVWR